MRRGFRAAPSAARKIETIERRRGSNSSALFGLLELLRRRYAKDKKYQAYHQEEEKQKLGDSRRGEAMPVNPSNAATSAITKKMAAQRNILTTS